MLKLSDHDVQGDGTFKEVNDHDRPYEGGVEGAMKLPELNEFLEAAEVKKKDEPDDKPLEPLPELPSLSVLREHASSLCQLPTMPAFSSRMPGLATRLPDLSQPLMAELPNVFDPPLQELPLFSDTCSWLGERAAVGERARPPLTRCVQ